MFEEFAKFQAAKAAAGAAAAPKPRPRASKKRKNPDPDTSGAENNTENDENDESEDDEKAVQKSRRSKKGGGGNHGGKAAVLSTDPKVVKARHTSQFRTHMKDWYAFVAFYKDKALAIDVDACDYHPTDEDLDEEGAMERPGKVGDNGTNTSELNRQFIVGALPRRKYNKNQIHPRVVLEFADPLYAAIDTSLPEFQAGASKKMSRGGGGGGRRSSSNKRRRTNDDDLRSGASGTEGWGDETEAGSGGDDEGSVFDDAEKRANLKNHGALPIMSLSIHVGGGPAAAAAKSPPSHAQPPHKNRFLQSCTSDPYEEATDNSPSESQP